MATPLPTGSLRSPRASRAAATVRRESWFMRRSFIGAMKSRGLKSRTRAAECEARPAVSKRSMGAMAAGAIMPRPVMAMRIFGGSSHGRTVHSPRATEIQNAEYECRIEKATRQRSIDPRSGIERRHHLGEQVIERAVHEAVRRAG